MPTTVRPDLDLVIQLYKAVLPDYDFMLRKLESENKWLRLSPRLHELTAHFKCQHYSQLYQGEDRILTSLFRAIFDSDDKIRDFIADLNTKSLDEQYQFLNNLVLETMDFGKWMDEHWVHLDFLDWSATAQTRANQEWQKIPKIQQQEFTRYYQYTLQFTLSSFFNHLALMVHGRKLTQLVNEAMSGDDHSFGLAIHIDKSIIEHIPYFKHRYHQAQETGNQSFLQMVGKRLATPHLNGRIRHRLLFILFALLESTHWLDDLKHREILDLCDQLGLDNYEQRIETENALTKRLIEYRKFQKSSLKSMP